MAFPPEFLDEIRARVPIADVVGRRVKLIKRGREHSGLCPFHNEKTPSFTVSEEKGFYHCFGCGAHGDAIGFVMRMEGLSFPEAVERLAGEAGLQVPQASPEERAAARRRADLYEVVEAAAAWFEERLAGSEGSEARAYLTGRGLRAETVATFRLGYAPDRRGQMRAALNARGLDDAQLAEAGLIKLGETPNDAPRDYFFNRIVFPITDRRGRAIAFGGRALGESRAKYLNSPETPLFHKGRVLYNLARARQAAHDTGELIVCEGYMDVIALGQAGFPAAVAPLGTAITEEQIAELWRLADEPVLCLDGDQAGRRAGFRAAERALGLLRPGRSLRFAMLPTGEDPDSLVQGQGAAALRTILAAARPLSEFIWKSKREGKKFDTPEKVSKFADELVQITNSISDDKVRGAYEEKFALYFKKEFGFSPWKGKGFTKQFVKLVKGQKRPLFGPRGPALGIHNSPESSQRRREQVLLAAAIIYPELVCEFAEELAEIELASPDLNKLRKKLLDIVTVESDLDSNEVKRRLASEGFSRDIDKLFGREVRTHAPFMGPDGSLEYARKYWVELFQNHRLQKAQMELSASEITTPESGILHEAKRQEVMRIKKEILENTAELESLER